MKLRTELKNVEINSCPLFMDWHLIIIKFPTNLANNFYEHLGKNIKKTRRKKQQKTDKSYFPLYFLTKKEANFSDARLSLLISDSRNKTSSNQRLSKLNLRLQDIFLHLSLLLILFLSFSLDRIVYYFIPSLSLLYLT